MSFLNYIPKSSANLKSTIKAAFFTAALFVAAVSGAEAQTLSVTQPVNLRQGPGVKYARIAALPRGAMVHVDYCRNGWCRLRSSWGIGWASRRYLGSARVPYAPRYAAPRSQIYLGLNIGPGFAYDDPFYDPYYRPYYRPYYWPYHRPYYRPYWNPRWGIGPVRPPFWGWRR